MSLLGHTTLQMTSRYTHATPENLRTAVDFVDRKTCGVVGNASQALPHGRATAPERQKRAKIAPTRYWNGRNVSVWVSVSR
jgi:hypothetical protein